MVSIENHGYIPDNWASLKIALLGYGQIPVGNRGISNVVFRSVIDYPFIKLGKSARKITHSITFYQKTTQNIDINMVTFFILGAVIPTVKTKQNTVQLFIWANRKSLLFKKEQTLKNSGLRLLCVPFPSGCRPSMGMIGEGYDNLNNALIPPKK